MEFYFLPYLLHIGSTHVLCIIIANQLSSVGSYQESLYADSQTSWSADNKQLDGLHEVEANSLLRFPEDERVREACRMLRSSVPVYLKVERAPEDSEIDRRQKLQTRLLALCKRILGCSVGRGMMTIGTVQPLMAEALPIPPLCLSGRVPPNNQIVPLDAASATPEHLMWPEFHNGVAAAFRLGKQIKGQDARYRVTRNWILYNKTNAQQNKQIGEHTHAGVLLGLGLLGHLHVLIIPEICEYLTQGQETTTVAILIGVAASKIGTCDSLFSKTLSLHLPPLLPPEAWDIEISPVVQSAAIVGLGLLYCQSGHRLIIEFLLEELIRKPSTDRCENREGLALSAAWALGMVLLPTASGQADCLQAIADLRIEERLHSLIVGGERPQTARLFTSDYDVEMNTKSSRILETIYINVNITAPAACIALGIIFMKSRNEKVLGYLSIPASASALDLVRPDRLFYHALAHCLVEWDSKPITSTLMLDQVPVAVLDALDADRIKELSSRYTGPYGRSRQRTATILPSTAFLLKINIIAGYGLGLGLVYAGTFNVEVKHLLLEQIKWLQK
ncbi:hypothetical protein EON65_09710 [archaeon]|nr:MAG: hypothetical protein EON65_09710 [archaeon]